jgi:hypothetical protein
MLAFWVIVLTGTGLVADAALWGIAMVKCYNEGDRLSTWFFLSGALFHLVSAVGLAVVLGGMK